MFSPFFLPFLCLGFLFLFFRQVRSLWSSSCHPYMSPIFLGSSWCVALCCLESKYSVRVRSLWGIWSPSSPLLCCFLVPLSIYCSYFSGCRSSGIAIICVQPWSLGCSRCTAVLFHHLFCIPAFVYPMRNLEMITWCLRGMTSMFLYLLTSGLVATIVFPELLKSFWRFLLNSSLTQRQ
jgi:hypothetical protein